MFSKLESAIAQRKKVEITSSIRCFFVIDSFKHSSKVDECLVLTLIFNMPFNFYVLEVPVKRKRGHSFYCFICCTKKRAIKQQKRIRKNFFFIFFEHISFIVLYCIYLFTGRSPFRYICKLILNCNNK